ncbi:MAG: hypothetical protein R3B68_14865 [Phycisphaerales bacterium]
MPHLPRIATTPLLILALALPLAACSTGQRTVTTNTEGARIPPNILAALRPDMAPADWLELHYGPPDHTAPTDAGGRVLTWTHTTRTHEHRPDPHDEIRTERSHVELDAQGQIRRAWSDSHDQRLN